MYRVTFKDGRPPINIEADKMQCSPGCVEFFTRGSSGQFELVVRLEGVKDADWVKG